MNGPAVTPGHVLVVDDDDGVRTFVADALADVGHQVAQAADGRSALARMAEHAFHVVITDLRMPALDGLGLLRAIRHEHAETSSCSRHTARSRPRCRR